MLLRAAALATLMLLAAEAAAFPQQAKGTKEQQDACQADVFKVCNDAVPDEDKIVVCLNKNLHKLSFKCQILIEPDPKKRSQEYPQ